MPGSPAGTPHLADPENWVVSASAEAKAAQRRASAACEPHPPGTGNCRRRTRAGRCHRRRGAARRTADGTVVSFYRVDGVVVDVPSPGDGPGLQTGDVVTQIAGHRLADGLGGLARPQAGEEIAYDIARDGTTRVTVRVDRTDPYPLLVARWETSSSSSRWPHWRPRCSCGDPRSSPRPPRCWRRSRPAWQHSRVCNWHSRPRPGDRRTGALALQPECDRRLLVRLGPALAFGLQLPRDDPALRPDQPCSQWPTPRPLY